MHHKQFPLRLTSTVRTAVTIVLWALFAAPAYAVNYMVLYSFPGTPDGWGPSGPMVMDAAGNVYGTTIEGGTVVGFQQYGCGTVFELSPPSISGGAWTERILHSFQDGNDGCFAAGGLAMDKNGNLYGTTLYGGSSTLCSNGGCGTIFSLTPPSNASGSWTYRVIYRFTGGTVDGAEPDQLTVDDKGVIYGTARLIPFPTSNGSIFELKRIGTNFVFTTIYTFGLYSGDGVDPSGGVTIDPRGNLFGSTLFGGIGGFGTVYELTPPTNSEGEWSELILHSFPQILNFFYEGGPLLSRIVIDSNGNLFGTTAYEGSKKSCNYGCGIVYELTPPAKVGRWPIAFLFDLSNNYGDGSDPDALYLDQSTRTIYGTTGGNSGSNGAPCGTFFRLKQPSAPSQAWTPSILHTFTGLNDGCLPNGNIIRDSSANFYGVTAIGGDLNCNNGAGCGTVFEITP